MLAWYVYVEATEILSQICLSIFKKNAHGFFYQIFSMLLDPDNMKLKSIMFQMIQFLLHRSEPMSVLFLNYRISSDITVKKLEGDQSKKHLNKNKPKEEVYSPTSEFKDIRIIQYKGKIN